MLRRGRCLRPRHGRRWRRPAHRRNAHRARLRRDDLVARAGSGGRRRRGLHLANALGALCERLLGETLRPCTDDGRGREVYGLLERERHLARRRVAILRIAREPAQHDVVDRAGDERIERARRVDLLHHDLAQDVAVVLALEEAAAGEHLPEHHRGRVHIGTARRGVALELLGREVRDLALDGARRRHFLRRHRLRDAEVDHARDPVRAHDDVLR